MGILWRWVPGYKGLYKVSDNGLVKSVKRMRKSKARSLCEVPERLLRQFPEKGYLYVNLWKDNKIRKFGVHVLVAKAFVPNPYGKPDVNHLDTNKTNNRKENLEWVTKPENMKHAKVNGLLTGRKHRGIKLLKSEVRTIKKRLRAGEKRSEIALEFKVSVFSITDIALGRTWSDI